MTAAQTMSEWMSLPHVCLRHVFRFLPDWDRVNAALVCHHWHNVMRSPSLWRTRFFHFSARFTKHRQSEYTSAVSYMHNLGSYLHRLEVFVYPPQKSIVAQRLKNTITRLFSELIRVNSPLQSLSLVRLELDRQAWTLKLRNSLVDSLVDFFYRGSSKLTSVCLKDMHNNMTQGLELLQALLNADKRAYPQHYISSLNLVGFFSHTVKAYRNPTVANILAELQGLTNLTLSYSCLSDELLIALQKRHKERSQTSGRKGTSLQTLSLYCSEKDPHQQVVCGDSWASLASACPDLKVRFTMSQITNTDHLIRMLQHGIPMADFGITVYYVSEDGWSAKPLLCDLLPQYRHSLQFLSFDLCNCCEPVDEELLMLVKECECLKQLKIWAFLDIRTVEKLLHIRMTLRTSLNYIKVRIYSSDDNIGTLEEQLEEIKNSYLHLPHELDFFALVFPFV